MECLFSGHRWYQVLLPWRDLIFFALFLYSCGLVNCRWGAKSETTRLSASLRHLAPLNGRMSSLETGSQVPRSGTFVFLCALRWRRVSVSPAVSSWWGKRVEKNEKMTRRWVTHFQNKSLSSGWGQIVTSECSGLRAPGTKGWVIQDLSVAASFLPWGTQAQEHHFIRNHFNLEISVCR